MHNFIQSLGQVQIWFGSMYPTKVAKKRVSSIFHTCGLNNNLQLALIPFSLQGIMQGSMFETDISSLMLWLLLWHANKLINCLDQVISGNLYPSR